MAAVKANNTVHMITEYAKSPGKFPEQIFLSYKKILNLESHTFQSRKLLLEVYREQKHKWSLYVPKIGTILKVNDSPHPKAGMEKHTWSETLSYFPFTWARWMQENCQVHSLDRHSNTFLLSHSLCWCFHCAMKPFIFCPKFLLSSKTAQWMGIQFSWEQYLI